MYETILVATDGSEGALAAVEHAVALAAAHGATLHALYVADVRMSPITAEMDREEVIGLLEDAGDKPTAPVMERAEAAGVPAQEAVRSGVPHAVVREYADAHGVDLVVVGTHGRTGLAHTLLGSTAERIVRTAEVPVMTVPLERA